MARTLLSPANETSDPLSAVAACLQRIGSRDFNPVFLDVIHRHVGADQIMVFSYAGERAECFLSFNTHVEDNANRLAQDYLEGGYLKDPLAPEIARLASHDGIDIFSLEVLARQMPQQYRSRFFTRPGIVDKLTILARRDGTVLGINLYRFAESGPFAAGACEMPLLNVIGQIALLHYSDRQPQDMRSPLLSLSDRERQICEGILNGKTTEAIAWELEVAPSTVTTYRKRAYVKLGINSKSALFTLCAADP